MASTGFTLSSLFGGFETVSTIFFFHFSQLSIQVANPICLVLQPSIASQALLTYLEQKRLEAQRQYLEEWEYLCQNKDSFDRIIKEEQEALAK